MDYTLATVRRDVVLDMLDDEEYDPGIVDRAINRAQREIFNQYELTFQEKIFSGTVPEASTMLRYPDDIALAQDHVITSPDGVQRSIAAQHHQKVGNHSGLALLVQGDNFVFLASFSSAISTMPTAPSTISFRASTMALACWRCSMTAAISGA